MAKKKSVDMLELKASLLVEGVRATEEALAGVGADYKEQNHGLFGWDMEEHVGMELPDDFLLPDGTVVQFRKNSASPFQIHAGSEGLTLFHGEDAVTEVRWIKRPAFYDREVSRAGRKKIGRAHV